MNATSPDPLDAASTGQFGKSLAHVLNERNSEDGAWRVRSGLNPRLSYGRHRGPARRDSRRAAVVIMIYPHRRTGRLCLTLTRRPMTLAHHRGQICLPGGRIEANETAIEAALREYREELGILPDVIDIAGQLPPIYVFASDNQVDTVVVVGEQPGEPWRPDPAEVDEVIEMPLEALMRLPRLQPGGESNRDPEADDGSLWLIQKKMRRAGKSHDRGEVFHFEFGYRAIGFVDCDGVRRELWGATAMLLENFAAALSDCT